MGFVLSLGRLKCTFGMSSLIKFVNVFCSVILNFYTFFFQKVDVSDVNFIHVEDFPF